MIREPFSLPPPRPSHGGRLRKAAAEYRIPLADWLDLSTGISPNAYPVPVISPDAWARLPEDDDGLIDAAARYYGSTHILPVAGSQAAIQSLPAVLARQNPLKIAIAGPSYAEHWHAWQHLDPIEIGSHQLESMADTCDIVLVVNPDNPSGHLIPAPRLLDLHARLSSRGGWLIVDEAFIDPIPEHSLASHAGQAGLIVLRSLGKFFGLAGARVGFVLAPAALRDALDRLLGPWCLNGPAREVARVALLDEQWQHANRSLLKHQSERLSSLLSATGFTTGHGCALFRVIDTPQAKTLHDTLARQGILVRLFERPMRLRFGLPSKEAQWQRLEAALQALPANTR